jgi:tetratricopeptide repeat protein 21B
VVNHEFQLENAHYFEKAWLMMADHWISVNNYPEAEKELSKVLKHNKSNVKAYEYMGLIKEKEKDHEAAALHYQTAFKMSNNKNAGVGFRLAFNYLKAQRYTDTLDVGKQILKVIPDYPRLKDDLLLKAR